MTLSRPRRDNLTSRWLISLGKRPISHGHMSVFHCRPWRKLIQKIATCGL